MTRTLTELIGDEEAKRRRNWDSSMRWKALQEMIAWAESQATVRRNTKEACLANQQRLLAHFATRNAP
jgi:hypothetical protein